MSEQIYKEDTTIIFDIPGGNGHVVSTEVLLQVVQRALKGVKATRGHETRGGRLVMLIDGDGRVFINGEVIYVPKALELFGIVEAGEG